MTSITGDYLVNIIERCINTTIYLRRNISIESVSHETIAVTDEEIVDFIISIPYFDIKLKDFIVGNESDQTIISQTWENEFIKKCIAWATNEEWLKNDISFVKSIYRKEREGNCLSLPY
ncbi:hypothetical protein LK994_03495 [Ferruginibacter lapsinanis]|uniref:hypothetical protein n=1 Tax=Ferruginibacter lapsinanis TaxID=563172 RepID=UPI001E3FD258|nr:hypothetical protein [Ferruginibacter lapsinanis]UEG50533.1 hypothetical protein LK994_03495 [Ferruginibacter lapsinanis]